MHIACILENEPIGMSTGFNCVPVVNWTGLFVLKNLCLNLNPVEPLPVNRESKNISNICLVVLLVFFSTEAVTRWLKIIADSCFCKK